LKKEFSSNTKNSPETATIGLLFPGESFQLINALDLFGAGIGVARITAGERHVLRGGRRAGYGCERHGQRQHHEEFLHLKSLQRIG
jgi:hypothetical protein